MQRNTTLHTIGDRREPWDMIVIGGGATGVGCAVDAASRGYDVLLLEQHDFGKGTSSRSTKLVHGGVRYLAQGNISLVRESLRERGILLKNAPHVVHKQAFVVPCYSLWQKFYYGVGLKVYDLLSGKYSFGQSRILSAAETIERLPTITKKGLAGGILYYDGQFDDTRLLTDLVATAQEHGAAMLNYAKVISLTKDDAGKVSGAAFEDVVSGEQFSVKAAVVINATGAFCDAIRLMSDETSKPIVTLSQGIHLVFGCKFLPSENAIMIPKTSDGRVLFCIPWLGRTLIGTTETPIDRAQMEPHPLESEIDFVLATAARYLDPVPTRGDIRSIFAGIRPLVRSGSAKNTASLSRGHTIEIDPAGMLTITGGKWTTYRHMAEEAVDQAAALAGLERRPSMTDTLAIKGPRVDAAGDVTQLHSELPYTVADVVRAVRDEMAQTVEDVLARRTRALFLNADAAIEMARPAAEIMAVELGKDNDWVEKQIADFNKAAINYRRE